MLHEWTYALLLLDDLLFFELFWWSFIREHGGDGIKDFIGRELFGKVIASTYEGKNTTVYEFRSMLGVKTAQT